MESELVLPENIRWNSDGLVPCVVQDYKNLGVLMMAWMNKDSLKETIKTKKTVFWSRSRQKLWRKGDESGCVQHIKEILVDCDQDCLLVRVKQDGSGACHTGRPSCFYRHIKS